MKPVNSYYVYDDDPVNNRRVFNLKRTLHAMKRDGWTRYQANKQANHFFDILGIPNQEYEAMTRQVWNRSAGDMHFGKGPGSGATE